MYCVMFSSPEILQSKLEKNMEAQFEPSASKFRILWSIKFNTEILNVRMTTA